jgi:hypothetical protein
MNRTFPYKKYIKNWWMYWFPMNFFAHKEKDGNIHYRRFEKHFLSHKPNIILMEMFI